MKSLEKKKKKAMRARELTRDGLVFREQDFVRSEVSVRSSRLNLLDVLFLQAEFPVDTRRVASDRERRHTESVVGHSSVSRGGLSGRGSLPPGSASGAGVIREPGHVPSSSLVGSEEELWIGRGGQWTGTEEDQ